MLLEQLELSQAADLIPRIYNAPAPRDAMAALAPVVFRAAAAGDEVASTICRSAAQQLVELVLSVVERLTLVANEFDLALAGAVLVHQQEWAQLVVQSLAEAGAAPRSAVLVPAPVEGALALARRQWRNS
jgi:N-acetylglucosamine kinase-like BadF-type ATPase